MSTPTAVISHDITAALYLALTTGTVRTVYMSCRSTVAPTNSVKLFAVESKRCQNFATYPSPASLPSVHLLRLYRSCGLKEHLTSRVFHLADVPGEKVLDIISASCALIISFPSGKKISHDYFYALAANVFVINISPVTGSTPAVYGYGRNRNFKFNTFP